jgi:hypothetical protein
MPELAGPEWELGIAAIGQAAFDGAGGVKAQGPFVVFPKN